MHIRLSIVCLCLTAILAVGAINLPNRPQEQRLHEIKVVTNIRDFVKSHPGVRVLSLYKQPRNQSARNQSVRYTLGGRVSGDRLVAQGADVFAYPAKKDVTIQITYPESGTGSVLTSVEIVCTQDTNDGNAYVVAGGINQRFISIVVEANQTENFSYTAMFYGTD